MLAAEAGEDRAPGLSGHLGDAADLDAVARGEDHRLVEHARPREVDQDLAHLVALEGELLAHLDGRRVMTEAGDEERAHHAGRSIRARAPADHEHA